MALLGIFGMMLVLMLMRVALPIGPKVTGKPVVNIKLDFRERLLLHRMNIYSIGILLLVATVSGVLPRFWELFVLVPAVAILFIPVRYRLTTDGIACNNVVFRAWSDFTGVEVGHRWVRLVAKEGMRPFDVRVLGSRQERTTSALRKFVPPADARGFQEVRARTKARTA